MNRLPVPTRLPGFALIVIVAGLVGVASAADAPETVTVPVDSERWQLINASRTEMLDRPCIAGRAVVQGVDLQNGTIEADMAVTGGRSYPGLLFRVQSPGDYERVYLRPHRPDLYGDVVQYTPSIQGISGWQLYSGPGYTSGGTLTPDTWMHLRLEMRDGQARLFLDDGDRPVLEVHDLQHGVSRGGVGIDGPRDGSACFSNFSYTPDDDLAFDAPPPPVRRPGMIRAWQLSQAMQVTAIETDLHPSAQELPPLEWRDAEPSPSGLLDVARYARRTGRAPDAIYARTTLHAEEAGTREYKLGYSDAVAVFLNGRILYSGNSAYRQRDPSFLGIVGLNDSVYLPLEKGDNELLLLVVESFGGWGFMFQDAEAIFSAEGVSRAWETPEELLVPESVLYDAQRGQFYVSNLDSLGRTPPGEGQFVSRLSPDGEILDLKWVGGLNRPTGMTLSGGHLFVVERGGLVEIDIDAAEIVARHPIPGAAFPNDVTADGEGALYVSDSGANVIHRVKDGAAEVWLEGPDVEQPNGMRVEGDRLVWGNNGDGRLKAASLDDRGVTTLAWLGDGIIDGIAPDGKGGLLVSHWQGRLFRVSASGDVEKILDTTAPGGYLADFDYAPDRKLVVAPTFYGNTVSGYSLAD